MNDFNQTKGTWFIYDGECPICKNAALGLRIKAKYGPLHLINARDNHNHPLMHVVNEKGYDLDQGMIIFNGNRFFYGKDALRSLAIYTDRRGIFNLLSKILYRSACINALLYLCLRAIRTILLKKKCVSCIDNLNRKSTPVFQHIFGKQWEQLPRVMKKHYGIFPYSNDVTAIEGRLDVYSSGAIKFMAPLISRMGIIPPYHQKNTHVTVRFESDKHHPYFHFKRIFYFNDRRPHVFNSKMMRYRGNEVIEIMRFGLCWRTRFSWCDGRIKMQHAGYGIVFFNYFLPLPLTAIFGSGNAEEIPVDDKTFDMRVQVSHPWWGIVYEYKGRFIFKEAMQ